MEPSVGSEWCFESPIKSHKLLRPTQFLEKPLQFWNGPLWSIDQALPHYSMLQYICRGATAKLVSQILTNNIDHGRRAIAFMWSFYQNLCEVLSKKKRKVKEGLEKPGIYKNWSVGIIERYNKFLLLKVNILSMQSVIFFLACDTARAPISLIKLFNGIHY